MTLDRNTLMEAAKIAERTVFYLSVGKENKQPIDGIGAYIGMQIRALAAAQPEGWVLVPRERIQAAMNELGVPQPGYPQPVANAYEILSAMLSAAGGKS